ncbi:sulfate transporter family protein [Xanthobacter autotrophicus]|uniref:sulfate transporter family protein n=1 Tax=Xanthobacter autotrophicus TaxID=280 RepID=UPI0024A65C3A|nr:sulfate transporter family protein [Xanthobacter autotrophicus]MDI4655972.1 sulfate transporter family protein [Xanthobacter autotrophicus]
MLAAALDAFRQTFSPLLRGLLLKSMALAALLLVGLAIGLEAALTHFVHVPSYPWVETTLAIIAGFGLVFGIIYLMPAVSSLVAGLFLDDVAERVEQASYPADPPGRPQPVLRSILYALRFFGVVLAVNLAALLLLLVPGVNIIIFYVANAYLISREYFELAAMRYRTPEEARRLRQAHGVKVFVAGLLIAPILFVPILNLILPVFGTAFMVHFHRRIAPLPVLRDRDGALVIEGRAL